jgi:hypothetical protein
LPPLCRLRWPYIPFHTRLYWRSHDSPSPSTVHSCFSAPPNSAASSGTLRPSYTAQAWNYSPLQCLEPGT